MKGKQWVFAAASLGALTLAACSNANEDAADAPAMNDTEANDVADDKAKISGPSVGINEEVTHDGDAIEGGTLKVALVSETPFQGVFSREFAIDEADNDLLGFSHDYLLETNADNTLNDQGIATQTIDEDEKTVTFTIKDGAKWSDGEPLTADDIIFTHELLASPEYTGVRYDADSLENIVGLKEYHEGQADHIAGIEKVDDQTVKFHLNELKVSLKYGKGGPWISVAPKHQLENIPIKDLEGSPELRQHPVGLGAFRVTKIVDGESVEFEANEYYFHGKPKIDKIEVTRVPESGIVPALENNQYDLVLNMPINSYDTYKDLPGYDYITQAADRYNYLGFKLGTFDAEKGENVPDPNAKLADPKLRQAFGYAIDNDLIGERFYHGLTWNANSKISPNVEGIYDDEQPGFYYDPDKSRQILADAGYEDVNGDGYVEDKDGNELVFNLATTAGGDIAEPLANYYIQALKEVGLHVELVDGRLLDFQDFNNRLQSDDPAIDVYVSGWGLGSDPNPYITEGRKSILNYTRYATEEQDELLASLTNDQAFHDPDYLAEQYKKWQAYIVKDPQTIPLSYGIKVTPVNKRVKHLNLSKDPEQFTRWHAVELTADEPLGE